MYCVTSCPAGLKPFYTFLLTVAFLCLAILRYANISAVVTNTIPWVNRLYGLTTQKPQAVPQRRKFRSPRSL